MQRESPRRNYGRILGNRERRDTETKSNPPDTNSDVVDSIHPPELLIQSIDDANGIEMNGTINR